MNRAQIHNIKPEEVIKELSSFDDVNWTEPTETFKELCKQRAQQIRDSYDYIILSFSGGSDSTTVLNTFLENNIYIDEILILKYDIPNIACIDGQEALSYLIAKKYRGYVNVVTLNYDNVCNFIKKDNNIIDGPNFTGQLQGFLRYNVNQLTKYGFTQHQFRKNNICHLYGEQDPDVVKIKNKYYARFSIKNKFTCNGGDKENTFFFTSLDFPQLHVKQCFEAVKYMYNNPNSTRQIKLCVRDCYSPLVSPVKSLDNPRLVLENIDSYSEPTIILKHFVYNYDNFKDIYMNAIYKFQTDISEKINILNKNTFKYYLLELGSGYPDN